MTLGLLSPGREGAQTGPVGDEWHSFSSVYASLPFSRTITPSSPLCTAAYQHLGAGENRETSEGVKTAFKHFQTAAGLIELCQEKCVFGFVGIAWATHSNDKGYRDNNRGGRRGALPLEQSRLRSPLWARSRLPTRFQIFPTAAPIVGEEKICRGKNMSGKICTGILCAIAPPHF